MENDENTNSAQEFKPGQAVLLNSDVELHFRTTVDGQNLMLNLRANQKPDTEGLVIWTLQLQEVDEGGIPIPEKTILRDLPAGSQGEIGWFEKDRKRHGTVYLNLADITPVSQEEIGKKRHTPLIRLVSATNGVAVIGDSTPVYASKIS